MRRYLINNLKPLIVLFFLFLPLVSSTDPSFAAQKSKKSSTAHVHKVHDGDTVTLRLNGKKYRTRLIGIDAPEMGQKPWGRQAKQHLVKIMRQTNWTVIVETDEERQDKYGRLLAYLWTKKNAMINEKMVADGFAETLSIPPNVKYADKFSRAEQSAKTAKKGIWGPNGLSESPSEYKKAHPRK
jgi:micrococcal nuclease